MTTSLDGTRLEPDAPSLSTGSAGDASAIMLWSSAVSAKRLADAAERIAAALEQIAGHLAPVITMTRAPEPDAEGWIEWDGSLYQEPETQSLMFTPVKRGTLIDVRFRDGQILSGAPAGELSNSGARDAGGVFFRHDGEDNDIVAYRLAATK